MGKDETEVINSISRADLNIALINAAEEQGAAIHFNQRCTGSDLKTGVIRLRDENTGEEVHLETDAVIGCDGSASAIRTEMLKLSRFNFSQQYLEYGYKELTIPAGTNGEHRPGGERPSHLAEGQSYADRAAQYRRYFRVYFVSSL